MVFSERLLEHRALLWCEDKPKGPEGQKIWGEISHALLLNGAPQEARVIVAFKVISEDEDEFPHGFDGAYDVTACDGTSVVPCETTYLYVLGIVAQMSRSPVVTFHLGVFYIAACESLGQLVQSRPLLRYLESMGSPHGSSQALEEQIAVSKSLGIHDDLELWCSEDSPGTTAPSSLWTNLYLYAMHCSLQFDSYARMLKLGCLHFCVRLSLHQAGFQQSRALTVWESCAACLGCTYITIMAHVIHTRTHCTHC